MVIRTPKHEAFFILRNMKVSQVSLAFALTGTCYKYVNIRKLLRYCNFPAAYRMHF